MRSSESLRCSFIVLLPYFLNLECYAQLLDLYEGDICRKGEDSSSNHICRKYEDCVNLNKGMKQSTRYPQICSFDESTAIICCPPANKMTTSTTTSPTTTTTLATSTIITQRPTTERQPGWKANEKCQQYSQLIYKYIKDPALLSGSNQYIKIKNCVDVITLIVNGTKAVPKEFPHMALIGYFKEKPNNRLWLCGGSLISERWILTAAHCEKISNVPASWARLGELDYNTDKDGTIYQDYKIVQHIIHPNYQPTRARYNDLALFRLEKEVTFSEYIRPICLNTYTFLKPTSVIATGWGQTASGEGFSHDLLKVILNIIPARICSRSYPTSVPTKLPNGIVNDSMICAGSSEGKDTCGGDSGGPIQIQHVNYTCMYIQMGITSFGKSCAEKNSPGVYTRVSKYIQWIENIVWPTK